MSNKLNVYWTPGNFVINEESWSYIYATPEKISNNKFVFKSVIEDSFRLPDEEINRIQKGKVSSGPLETDSFLALFQPEKSDIPEHAVIQYNMNWLFFAEESALAKMTLKESEAPVKGAKFVDQKKDIGTFYTANSLKYHIPLGSKEFKITKNSPLFYLEIDTDKDVVFKRYHQTTSLRFLQEEYTYLKERYGKARSEAEILEGLVRSDMSNLVLSEIKKNLV